MSQSTSNKTPKRVVRTFESSFDLLLDYKRLHGDCMVPYRFETACGYKLGEWVRNRRQKYKNNNLAPSHINQLNKLGFVWCVRSDHWQSCLGDLIDYVKQYGDCCVPHDYKTALGHALGQWVVSSRKLYWNKAMPTERIERLNALGFDWSPKNRLWQKGIDALIAYKQEHGDCLVPFRYKTRSDFALGSWVASRRVSYEAATLSKHQIDQLDELDFVWRDYEYRWQLGFDALTAYNQKHGDCLVPTEYKTPAGYALGLWVFTQRADYKHKVLVPDRVDKLNTIRFVWSQREHDWQVNIDALIAYKMEHGDCLVPRRYKLASGFVLGQWVIKIRLYYNKNYLLQKRIDQLNAMGFVWKLGPLKSDTCMHALTAFKAQNGENEVPANYRTESGFPLGYRLTELTKAYKKNELSQALIRQLNAKGLYSYVSANKEKLVYVPRLQQE